MVAHVVVKSRFLDFRGLILIVPVFNIVVFDAMKMWVMGGHLGEIGVGGAPERLWENEAEGNAASGGHAFRLVYGRWRKGLWKSARGEGCQKAMNIRDSGKRGGKGWKVTKGPSNIFGKFPGEKSGGVV